MTVMRQPTDSFMGQEMRLVYVAKRLRDALRLEDALTGAGIDYVVETERYTAGLIFRTQRVGAFFYVRADSEPVARETLRRGGWVPFEEPITPPRE
jgi:hypothetical protein